MAPLPLDQAVTNFRRDSVPGLLYSLGSFGSFLVSTSVHEDPGIYYINNLSNYRVHISHLPLNARDKLNNEPNNTSEVVIFVYCSRDGLVESVADVIVPWGYIRRLLFVGGVSVPTGFQSIVVF